MISSRPLSILIAVGLVVLSAVVQSMGQPAAARDPVAIAGTTVSLVPPDDFEKMEQLAGFRDRSTGALLTVQEYPPDAYGPLAASVFDSLEVARKSPWFERMEVEKRREIETANGKVVLLAGRQTIGTTTRLQWLALLRGSRTVMIVAQAAPGMGLDDETIATVIKTVKLGPPQPLAERLALSAVKVEAAAPFRFADVAIGNAVMLVVGPKDFDPTNERPFILVNPIFNASLVESAEGLAERFLRGTRGIADVTIDQRATTTFAGVQGVRLDGTFVRQGLKKRFVQYLSVPAEKTILRVFAETNADAFGTLLPAIEKVAASVALKPGR